MKNLKIKLLDKKTNKYVNDYDFAITGENKILLNQGSNDYGEIIWYELTDEEEKQYEIEIIF